MKGDSEFPCGQSLGAAASALESQHVTELLAPLVASLIYRRDGRCMRVLMISDDPIIANLARRQLYWNGYLADIASD